MSDPMIYESSHSATSSPALEFGHTHCDKQDGPMINQSGQEAALANLSARQAKAAGLMMSGTYGQTSTTSSSSAGLQQFLDSRLQAKISMIGSTLYRLTWKPWVTPLGVSRLRLRASALPMSESAFTGWPTPRTCKSGHTKGNPKRALKNRGRLEDAIFLLLNSREKQLASGQIVNGCVGLTDDYSQLNPEHCRWLMGIPKEWGELAPTETLSMLKRRKRS